MSGHCEWQGASGYPREDEGAEWSGEGQTGRHFRYEVSFAHGSTSALGNRDVVRGNSIFLQFTKPKSPGIVSRTAWN